MTKLLLTILSLHVSTLLCHPQGACNQHLLNYISMSIQSLVMQCNLARYWLRAPWGCHDSVETCSNVIICEIIVHLLVMLQNNKRCKAHITITMCLYFYHRYPACNAHAPNHTVNCGVSGCTYLPTLSHKWHDLGGGELFNIKLCFDFLYNFLFCKISHSEKNSQTYTYYHKSMSVFMYSTSYCQIFMKLEYIWLISPKIFIYRISWKSVQWEPRCSMRTDGQTHVPTTACETQCRGFIRLADNRKKVT
jgi:hypothetical protein